MSVYLQICMAGVKCVTPVQTSFRFMKFIWEDVFNQKRLYDRNHYCQPSIEVKCQLINGIQILLGDNFQSKIKISQSCHCQNKLQNNIKHENMFIERHISFFSKEMCYYLDIKVSFLALPCFYTVHYLTLCLSKWSFTGW